jgi:hypothetical protein
MYCRAHCKDKMPKIWNKYSQKRNIGASVPISTFICLWANLYIPTMELPFLLEEICGPILGIYKSLIDTWMWRLGLRPRNSQKRNIYTELPLQCGFCWIHVFKGRIVVGGGGGFNCIKMPRILDNLKGKILRLYSICFFLLHPSALLLPSAFHSLTSAYIWAASFICHIPLSCLSSLNIFQSVAPTNLSLWLLFISWDCCFKTQ